jgi:hypothetical protein
MTRETLPALVALCALTALWGCDSPFPDETLVERLRLLAVQAEPPEVGLDGRVDFRALVADPGGQGRPLEATWAVCLMRLDYAASDIACPGPDAYPLPADGLTASLSVPALVAWALEQGLPFDPGAPPGGELPETVGLFVGLEVVAGQDRVRGLKRFALRLAGQAAPNRNPRLAGLELDGEPFEEGPAGWPRFAAGSEHHLRPLVRDGSLESYTPAGQTEPRLETLLFSWFSTAGEFRDQRTVLDPVLFQDLAANRLTAPDLPGPAELWLVVRDDRWGVDWLRVGFEAVAAEESEEDR